MRSDRLGGSWIRSLKRCCKGHGIRRGFFLIPLFLAAFLSACAPWENASLEEPLRENGIESKIESEIESGAEASVSGGGSSSQPVISSSSSAYPLEEEMPVTIEIANGALFTDIARELAEAGFFADEAAVFSAAEELELSEGSLFSDIPEEGLIYPAEGYILPGKYIFLPEDDPEEVLRTLLTTWDALWSELWKARAESLGLTFHEALTIASIIEHESSFGGDQEVRERISAVIENRLQSGTPLQMDVTVFYLQSCEENGVDVSLYEESYDTYSALRLPPGPIGSPSEESFFAALYPAQTSDLFFIYDAEGRYYFAEDYETHLINVQTYLGE